MKRISTSTAVQNKFVDGNKATGQKATQFNAEWCNQVQEEICNLLEAAGVTVGGNDHQLKDLLTVLFVLDLKLKSMMCKKTITGGQSTVTSDGETISIGASGNGITDDSAAELSRLLLKLFKTSSSNSLQSEVSPEHVAVKQVGAGNATILVELLKDRISFKSGSGNSLTEIGSIVYNSTTGKMIFNGVNGIDFANAVSTASGITFKKSFSGGTSDVTANGEKILMSAEGSSVSDNSSSELSRMLLKFLKSTSGGSLQTEMSPSHVMVKSVGAGDANVIVDILNDRISFKSGSGNSVGEHASIVYDSSTGNITISGLGGITFADKIYAVMGLLGDIETDSITPATTGTPTPVEIGSAAGGVKLVGRTTGFKGKVSTNEIEAEDANYPVWVKAILKATNVPNDFVSVDSITNNDPASSRTLLVESAWTVGQVKRFLNTQSSDKVIWVYVDTSGGNRSITIPAHCFVTVACTGIYTNTYLDNEKFAVLAVEACNA